MSQIKPLGAMWITVPRSKSPVVGDTVSVPIEGGQDWLEIGTFTEASYNHDAESVSLMLRFSEGVEGRVGRTI